MTLALYGRGAKSELSGADFISQGSREALVRLSFSTHGKSYQAVWSCVVLNKKGAPLTQPRSKRELYQADKEGQWVPLEKTPEEVIGLNFDQFSKTVVLNQGEFAKFLTNAGRSVVVAAADTFRAAAVEQLETWATRAGVAIVTPEREGQDPASVAYQAVEKAIAESIDIVVIDTAGRLHTKTGLMDELNKMKRVVEKLAPISEVLLVLDATTGQNGVAQAQAFLDQAGVTGLVLTKLDGSAKAGFVLRVQEHTQLAIKLLGQGETIDDMTGFSPAQFARALTS
jgi:fused signal recognition particle receptor